MPPFAPQLTSFQTAVTFVPLTPTFLDRILFRHSIRLVSLFYVGNTEFRLSLIIIFLHFFSIIGHSFRRRFFKCQLFEKSSSKSGKMKKEILVSHPSSELHRLHMIQIDFVLEKLMYI